MKPRMTLQSSLAVTLLAAVAFACTTTRLMATVIPPIGLAPGSQYQLIFATADGFEPTSTNIADYNSFVTAEAGMNSLLPFGVTWRAVVSTPTVNANVNAPYIGLPIYNTAGQLVALATSDIYSSDLLTSIVYDQFGLSFTSEHENTWTGTVFGGIGGGPGGGLGGSSTAIYGASYTAQTPLWYDVASYTTVNNPLPLFALSGPITLPTPEPATSTLLTLALALLGALRLHHQWNRRG